MKLLSIEPTPSPHTMKLNIDESLPPGRKHTYLKENLEHAPEPIRSILSIEGVKSVFHTADFLAVDRMPKGDWRAILEQIAELLGGDKSQVSFAEADSGGYGEAQVYVQYFRNIPLQVRVRSGGEEVRLATPDRFNDAVMKVTESSPTLLKERKLVDKGIRYGDLQEIAEQMIAEIDATYSDEELARLAELAAKQGEHAEQEYSLQELSREEIAELFASNDWRRRYAALEHMKPTEEDLPLIAKALEDEHGSIRRLAVVYLGDIGGKQVLPYLYQALKDRSVQVRRTAGDTLNDIGDTDALQPMSEALRDPNKLVRWRAARFLYEFGDESVLDALRAAEDDEEFEVSLQVKMAIERITSGEEAAGSVWQQMARSRGKQ